MNKNKINPMCSRCQLLCKQPKEVIVMWCPDFIGRYKKKEVVKKSTK